MATSAMRAHNSLMFERVSSSRSIVPVWYLLLCFLDFVQPVPRDHVLPLPLSVHDDDLYTADDKLHLQEIAIHFKKLFPPHPTALPEAYLFASKKEFAHRVNAPGPMQNQPR